MGKERKDHVRLFRPFLSSHKTEGNWTLTFQQLWGLREYPVYGLHPVAMTQAGECLHERKKYLDR